MTFMKFRGELGLVLGLLLGFILELGRRIAARYRIPEVVERKEQLGTIRDGLFILVSLLLGFTLTWRLPASQNAVHC